MPKTERSGASYNIKASRGQDQTGHHQVRHATAWAAAVNARDAEYQRARSGQMTEEEASRVDINLGRL
jgi:hypothetical protein